MIEDEREKGDDCVFAVVHEVGFVDVGWIDISIHIDDSGFGDGSSSHEEGLGKGNWRSNIDWLRVWRVSFFLVEELHLDFLHDDLI